MAALISAKSYAIASSIRRKEKELAELEEKALGREEQVFKIFM
jgi:hypothetical protein